MDISKIIRENRLRIILAVAGAVGGFLYWKFVGCKTGSCPIKSVWYWSTLYGIVIGYLLGDIISGYISRQKSKENTDGQES